MFLDNSYKSIIKATSLFGSVHGLSTLLNLVRTWAVANLLGPDGVGLNAIFSESRELIHSVTNFGLDSAGIRGISQTFAQLHSAQTEEEQKLFHNQFVTQVKLLRSWVFLLAALGTLVCLILASALSLMNFGDFSYTWSYILLAPTVGLATLTCGEMTVLKAIRKLKAVAIITTIDVAIAIIVSLPLYYLYEIDGVLPAILSMAVVQYLVVIAFSYKAHGVQTDFSLAEMKKGFPMIVLGISFALSGAVGHFTQLGIRSFINHVDGLGAVGHYSIGYTIAMTVGGIIFASLDSEYFPRLSGLFKDIEARRTAVWRQVRISVSLCIPLVIIAVILLPYVLPLIFQNKYDMAIPLAQIACVGMIFRAMYLPFAYIPLAAGDSKTFLGLETISYIIMGVGVSLGYYLFGLEGAGYGLIISNLADFLITFLVTKIRYNI